MHYEISHYGGSKRPDTDPITIGPFKTLNEARAEIKFILGGVTYGMWEPHSDTLADDLEGWHESDQAGCGGWVVTLRVTTQQRVDRCVTPPSRVLERAA